MKYDSHFTLIGKNGQRRHPAIIKGTFQIGKRREALPVQLKDFVHAILVEGKSGRFVDTNGKNGGVLSYQTGRSVLAYELDPTIASAIGVVPIMYKH